MGCAASFFSKMFYAQVRSSLRKMCHRHSSIRPYCTQSLTIHSRALSLGIDCFRVHFFTTSLLNDLIVFFIFPVIINNLLPR